MNAKKCDRCMRFYDEYTDSANLILTAIERPPFIQDYEEIHRWELCPDCMKEMLYHLYNISPNE